MGETIWPRELPAFETSDGALHKTRSAADYWQRRLDGSVKATALLASGASLGEALRQGGFLPSDVYPELDQVFTTTKLIIEHWQCQNTPGYSPIRVDEKGGIFVHGDAGSWTGPYGAVCSATDVVRYWTDTKARLDARKERASNG